MVSQVTALIGNGLSIAYNPDLSCPRLTEGLLQDFARAEGDDAVARALRALGQQIAPTDPATGFEQLLGPVEAVAGAVLALDSLAVAVDDALLGAGGTVRESIHTSADFARRFYGMGVSRVLQLVDERSRHQGNSVASDFLHALADAAGNGCCVATLNYDNLVISGVLDAFSDRKDLADGRQAHEYQVRPGHRCIGWKLRDSAFIDSEACAILSLHGSLGWLRRGDEYVRFRMDDLRGSTSDFWGDAVAGNTEWQPVVVLTNQQNKNRRIAEYPFSLAYEMFTARLKKSPRWLIGGYGFGDECVNAVLRDTAARAESKARCLVVTHSDHPSQETIDDTLEGVQVTVFREGFGHALLTSTEWTDWASAI